MLKRGILILALGKEVYGKFAYNLALSIKAEDNIPIAIIHDNNSLNQVKNDGLDGIFDHFIPVKEEDVCYNGEFMPSRFKTKIYNYSPFNETIFIDADSVWIPGKKVEWLFYEINKLNFDFVPSVFTLYERNESKDRLFYSWGNKKAIFDHFNIDKAYGFSSYLMYFKKNDINYKFFNKSEEIYDYLIDKDYLFKYKWYQNQIPDEIAFSITNSLFNRDLYQWKIGVNFDDGGFFHDKETKNIVLNYQMKFFWLITFCDSPDKDKINYYNFLMEEVNHFLEEDVYYWKGDKFSFSQEEDLKFKKVINNNDF